MKQIFKSTNGTLNIVLLLLLALAAGVSFPGAQLENLFIAVVAFAGVAREWLKDGVKFRWNSNVLAYITTAILMLFPFLDTLIPALTELVTAFVEGRTDKILGALFVVANVAWKLMQDKPWKTPTQA